MMNRLIRFLKECLERGEEEETHLQSKFDKIGKSSPLWWKIVTYPVVALVILVVFVPVFSIYFSMVFLWGVAAKVVDRMRCVHE